MATRRVSQSDAEQTPHRKATTPEARENQLVALAMNLAEKQLRDGTASAQVVSHYLKAGSSREYLEKQRLAMDVELMRAKREVMESHAKMEELYEKAIQAMQGYQTGQMPSGDDG